MKRVLLTGATGFVGANLARRLIRDGHQLHLLLRHGYQLWRIKDFRRNVQLHELDLRDRDTLASLVEKIRPEWIFHLAAHGAYSWQTDLDQMVQTNIVGTMRLVEVCLRAGFEAFVNTGSSSEYGLKDHAPSEAEVLVPNSHYAVTKAAATMFCAHAARKQKAKLVTLRLYSVFGPYEEPGRLLPTLILHGLAGRLPPLVDPETARDFVYVDDAVDAYLLAATQPTSEPGAIYNVGSGVQTPLREVVRVVRQVLQLTVEPQWGTMPARQWDAACWIADSRRIHEQFGWRPRFDFEVGLREMIQWFRDHPALLPVYQKAAP